MEDSTFRKVKALGVIAGAAAAVVTALVGLDRMGLIEISRRRITTPSLTSSTPPSTTVPTTNRLAPTTAVATTSPPGGATQADKDVVAQKVKEIIQHQLNLYRVPLDASFVNDLGANELDALELVISLEEEFDIEIDTERIFPGCVFPRLVGGSADTGGWCQTTVREAIVYIQRRLEESGR